MEEKRTVVFMVTNGAGLGHLTRGLAVARRLAKLDPTLNIVFLTTSLATEVIREAGFMYFYTPTRAVLSKNTTASDWNRYISRQLNEIIEIYHPIALVYDGVYPYAGMLSSLSKAMIKRIWIKRECYKDSAQTLSEVENVFDLIIVPKEVSTDVGVDTVKKRYCNPIIFLDREEAHARELVRRQLGLTERNKLFYIQLGAGVINSTDKLLEDMMKTVLRNKDNRILLGESIIGKYIRVNSPYVFTIRNYPNSQYFKGIDMAISAAGYNTFHELLYFGVPSIFIPNMQTTKDDQLARIKKAEVRNACICLQESQNIQEYASAVDRLIANQQVMRKNALDVVKDNGAMQAAQYVNEFLKTIR